MKNLLVSFLFLLSNLFAIENYAGDLRFKSIKPITENTNYAITSMSYNVSIENIGTAVGSFVIYGYISKTQNTSDGIPVYSRTINSMAQNSNYSDVITLDIPCNQKAGAYYLLIKIDANNQITETNESNNLYNQAFKLHPTLKVDKMIHRISGASQYISLVMNSDSAVTLTKSVSWIQFPNGQNSQTFNFCQSINIGISSYISKRSAEIVMKRGNITKKLTIYQDGSLAPCFSSVNDLTYSSTSDAITVQFSNLNQDIKIEYRPHWSSEWKSMIVNSSPAVLSNLAQGSQYFLRLSAKCPNSQSYGNLKYITVATKVGYQKHKSMVYTEPHASLTRDVNTWYLGTSIEPVTTNTIGSADLFFTYKCVNFPGYMEVNTISGEVTDAVMEIYEETASGLTLVKTIDDGLFGSKMPYVKLVTPEYKANINYVVRIWSKGQPGGFQIKQTAVLPLQDNADSRSNSMDLIEEKNVHLDYCTNPVENLLSISFSSTYQDFIPLKIISLNGDLLWQETLQMIKGKNRAEVDVSSLASGIYLVRIGDKTKKFIKS